MFCRTCGRGPGDEGHFDERGVCAICFGRGRAGAEFNDLFCGRCGRGPGHAHIFDEHGVCWQCRQANDLTGLPMHADKAMRPPVPCGRCGGRSFVRVHQVRERGTTGGDIVAERPKPLALSFDVDPDGKVRLDRPLGLVEAYACRGCGLTELYTKDANEIPIGERYGTELFEVPDAGPFR